MVCGNFILPEPASYVFFYAFSNLRNLLYIIPKEELPRLENIVETYCKVHKESASRIEIKCMAEESL